MNATKAGPILVAGGARDPNVSTLLARLRERGLPVVRLLVGKGHHPSLIWDLETDELSLNGQPIRPRAAFVRHDVFEYMVDPRDAVAARAATWYVTVMAYLAAHTEVRCFNRDAPKVLWKPYQLREAKAAELAIPRTLVTNRPHDVGSLSPVAPPVVKPVAGGVPCKRLSDLLPSTQIRQGVAASPAIVQPELDQPELRVYGVNGRFFGFRLDYEGLDYRVPTAEPSIRPEPVPKEIAEGLVRLMSARHLHMDFGAADFKTCPETKVWRFLEINDMPMFDAFNREAGGAIADAMIAFLEA